MTGGIESGEALVTELREASELRFVAPGGERTQLKVRYGAWAYDGDGVLSRPVTVADSSEPLVQRAVSPELASSRPDAYLRLENEIRALLRLGRRYPASTVEIAPRLVGYLFDDEVPYLLCSAPAGEPLAGSVGQLLALDDRQELLVGLFRCLHFLAGAGVVHGGIDPQTARWVSGRVQLTNFTGALVAGEPVAGGAAGPWAAPDRRRPGGIAHPGDDVWSAAMLAYHVVTGQPVDGLAGPPDLTGRDALAGVLDGTFAAEAARRPDAARLLRRLRATEPLPPNTLDDPDLVAGRQAFDGVRRRKQPAPLAAEHPRRHPPPGRWWSQHRRGIAAVGILLVAIVSVMVAVVGT